MTYDVRYKGCPGCGQYEDRNCTCTGEAYEGGFVEILRTRGEIRCTCGARGARGWHHAPECPFYPVQGIWLSEGRAYGRHADEPHVDRPPPRYKK
jgi:hypothetical protein